MKSARSSPLCAQTWPDRPLSAPGSIPEDAREIIGEALARVNRVIEELGGTIKDLAGDGVLALFGAPVSHEDDKERAVRAGLRIIGEVTRYAEEVSRDWGIEALALRVGIESGLVVVGPKLVAADTLDRRTRPAGRAKESIVINATRS
jgi:class 3 adenylate cyclase